MRVMCEGRRRGTRPNPAPTSGVPAPEESSLRPHSSLIRVLLDHAAWSSSTGLGIGG